MLIHILVNAKNWNKFLRRLPLKLLSMIPISSKILGPPQGYYSSAKHWVSLPSNTTTSSYREINLSGELIYQTPKTLDNSIHWRFQEAMNSKSPLPTAFVVTIPQGRLWNNSAIISPDDKLIADLSKSNAKVELEMPKHHAINSQWKLSSVNYIEGTIAVLSVAGATHTYAHWMLDLLPRFELLYQNGISNREIDKFIVNAIDLPFQKETLSLLGIPESKILEGNKHPHICATRLIVPSLPRRYLDSVPQTPQWVCDFLKQKFLLIPSIHFLDQAERIYISRAQATHRRVLNEREVSQFLNQQGFQTVFLEQMSVREQAQTFASAKYVIAPHGASLANLVFCCYKTKVIELFSPYYVHYPYWILSNQIGLDYYYLIGEGERPSKTQYRTWYFGEDIEVNLQSLSKLMKIADMN